MEQPSGLFGYVSRRPGHVPAIRRSRLPKESRSSPIVPSVSGQFWNALRLCFGEQCVQPNTTEKSTCESPLNVE